MRTSLNDVKTIDDYIMDRMAPEDTLLFSVKMHLNPDLASDVQYQQEIHNIISEYGRKSIKAEIMAVHQILETAPQHRTFMQYIAGFFKHTK